LKRPTSIFLLYYALFSSAIGFGQELSISGFIDDSQGHPVSYANVLLMKSQDSTVIKGVSTDEKGFFLLDRLSEDSYVVKISFIGFNDVYRSVVLTENIDLLTIVLEENSEQLDEINIIAKRPTLKRESDRLVFNIENTALIEGNMFQVLKSTPGIFVLDNELQVKNSTPTVYINDKKVHLSSEELVQLLEGSSANSVKSVEVITNPSARYDASSGAVINIVMSKNLITGYRGNVFADYTQGVFPRYEAGMSHFFKNEKIDFFVNYTYSDSKINREQTDVINYFDTNNAIDQIFQSDVNRNTWSKTHSLNFNFDYSIDDYNTLSLSSNMLVLPYYEYLIKNNTNVLESDGALDYFIDTQNKVDDNKYNLGFDLDYIHRFKNAGEKLALNAHYTTYDYGRDQNVFSNYFDANNTLFLNTAFRTNNNQNTNIFTAQADYSLPIDDSTLFETGIKISNIKNDSDITQFDIVSGQETIDLNNTDVFEYDESIYAAYANYSKDWDKVSLTAGLRAEKTNLEGLSVLDNVKNEQDYLELFPTASLIYTINDNFSLQAQYKRSIQRPNYQNLNPFQFFLNDFTVVSGNPALQPIISSYSTIGTSFYKYFTVSTYYKSSKNNIYELPRQDNINNIITFQPINFDKTVEFGFDFEVYFNVTKRWSIYAVTSFYNIEDNTVFDGVSVTQDQWSNYSILQNDWTFLKDQSLNANLSMYYLGKNIQGYQITEDRIVSILSISKSIWNKRAVISLSAEDLFNTQDYEGSIRYLNQSRRATDDLDNRFIKLGFRYKFGNTNLSTNQRTKEQQETDRLEGGN
jgi:outer membrane receptor protein involved in Fe transport